MVYGHNRRIKRPGSGSNCELNSRSCFGEPLVGARGYFTLWRVLNPQAARRFPALIALQVMMDAASGIEMLRRRWRIAVPVAIATIVLLAVALTLATLRGNAAYPVVTWETAGGHGIPSARATTGLSGTLAGLVNSEGTACFWLVTPSNSEIGLLWPPHYSARGNPLTVFNEKEVAVASVGQSVVLDGATMAPESIQQRGIPGCPNTSGVGLVAP